MASAPTPLTRRALWLSLALAATLVVPAAAIDGFFPARGEGDFVLSYTAESYDEFWMGETKVTHPDVGRVETTSESLWGRFGLTNDLALIVNVPSVEMDCDGLGGYSDSGLQDLTAFLSWRAWGREAAHGRHTLALAGGVRTPLASYEANEAVDLGDGTTDALLDLAWQYERGPFYVSQMVGYELRGDDAPDGFPLRTTAGYAFGPTIVSAWYALYGAAGGTDIGEPNATFPSNEDEYQRVGLGFYASFSKAWGLSAGYFDTLDGRNSADLTGFSLGVVYRLR